MKKTETKKINFKFATIVLMLGVFFTACKDSHVKYGEDFFEKKVGNVSISITKSLKIHNEDGCEACGNSRYEKITSGKIIAYGFTMTELLALAFQTDVTDVSVPVEKLQSGWFYLDLHGRKNRFEVLQKELLNLFNLTYEKQAVKREIILLRPENKELLNKNKSKKIFNYTNVATPYEWKLEKTDLNGIAECIKKYLCQKTVAVEDNGKYNLDIVLYEKPDNTEQESCPIDFSDKIQKFGLNGQNRRLKWGLSN